MSDTEQHQEESPVIERDIPSLEASTSEYGAVRNVLGIFLIIAVILFLGWVNKGLFMSDKKEEVAEKPIKSRMPLVQDFDRDKPEKVEKPVIQKKVVENKKPTVINTYIPQKPKPIQKRTSTKEKEITPEERKRQSDMFSYGGKQTKYTPDNKQSAYAFEGADDSRIRVDQTLLEGARASRISDPSLWVTKGTFIDCALETAINSTLKGMVSCRITRDIYSTNGKVVLMDRGSRVVGEYRSALESGQNRLFVIWDRVETPNNVIINIGSNGTDVLGRSGHTGHIDTHFWDRFGSAIMFSIISDVGDALVTSTSDNNNNFNLGDTSEAAKDTVPILVENGLDIEPTLDKHHGEHINIFLAQDLDFRGVYELTSK